MIQNTQISTHFKMIANLDYVLLWYIFLLIKGDIVVMIVW
jgi:hypothetical protein